MAKRGVKPKLSDEQMREVIKSRLSPADLAKEFGVGVTTIYGVLRSRRILK